MVEKIWLSTSKLERLAVLLLIGILALTFLHWGVSKVLALPIFTDSGSVYREGVVGKLPTINPLFTDFLPINRDISRLMFSGLAQYNPEKQQFEPGLATYTINDDVTEYTFKLKKDLVWHDGEVIDADDVIFTFNDVIKNPNFANDLLKPGFVDVQVEKLDELTVKFTLPEPNAFFLSNMIVGLLPQHIYGELPVEFIGGDLVPELLIGSGPYKFEELNTLEDGSEEIILLANKDYYLGKPKIKKIKFYLFIDNDALVANQDKLQTVPRVTEDVEGQLNMDKFKLQTYQLPQYTAMFLNQENPNLSTERMRKILKNAFDKNYLAETLNNKQAIGGPYFFLEKIDKIPATDLDALKKDLDALGWTAPDGGIRRDAAGEQLRFILLSRVYDNPMKQAENKVVIDHIVEAGQELGIKIDLVEESADQFAAKLVNKAYDIVLFGQDFGYNLDAFSFWHSSQVGPNTFNLSNFTSVSADDVLDRLRATRDQDEQRDLLEKLNFILKAEAPAIFLYTQKYPFAFDNSVKNRTILDAYATIADRFYSVHEWKLR